MDSNITRQQKIDMINAGLKALPHLVSMAQDIMSFAFACSPVMADILKWKPLQDTTVEIDFMGEESDDPTAGMAALIYVDDKEVTL